MSRIKKTQMDMESSDQIVIHSSIALLQERFKRLRRVKEMRQRRELLRKLLKSENYTPSNHSIGTTHDKPSSKCFFETETVLNPPLKPPSQLVSLSLWPNSEIKHTNFGGNEAPEMMKSWPNDHKPLTRAQPIKFNSSDSHEVDTSLHL